MVTVQLSASSARARRRRWSVHVPALLWKSPEATLIIPDAAFSLSLLSSCDDIGRSAGMSLRSGTRTAGGMRFVDRRRTRAQ